MIAKTPLHAAHLAAHAKMVDFHGWEMPLHYGSQLNEHQKVRQDSGLFDVSHMTIVDLLGTGGRQFLRQLLTHDIDKLPHTGKALYSCLCNEHGGIIDDLIVYQRASDNYRLVLNSATHAKDMAWIREKSQGFAVGLQERPELAMLAIQGPQAIERLSRCLNAAQTDALSTLMPFECVDIGSWFFAKTGYTGEQGVEIIIPAEEALSLWQQLIEAGIQPCGLAARDTLRLEAGMLLYGQDMDETTTPLESGLGWTVSFNPEERDFIGKSALLLQKQQGVTRKLVGLTLLDKGIMRQGQKVITAEGVNGIITSGGYSPTLNQSIALARVPSNTGSEVLVDIRGKLIPARVSLPRFVKNGQAL
ncbi:MAG: glycine cleavage system protein T [Legionella sp.]|nr:MAG: glycine cleavage system protein T [Legionella sp.]PJE00178.1 MAG: glycine cleavage system protein T [Legionella sp.]